MLCRGGKEDRPDSPSHMVMGLRSSAAGLQAGSFPRGCAGNEEDGNKKKTLPSQSAYLASREEAE